MWFVLDCSDSDENKIADLCREKVDPRVLEDVFFLTYERLRRYEGSWHLETANMFPGKVFLQSEEKELLSRKLGGVGTLCPVSAEAVDFVRALSGDRHHIALSRGVIRKGVTCVEEGPLRGKEQMISRIDRHKRLAYLGDNKISGSVVKVGLEITEKN